MFMKKYATLCYDFYKNCGKYQYVRLCLKMVQSNPSPRSGGPIWVWYQFPTNDFSPLG